MPLTAIVVSKDRPAQLDLLLRSVTCHADNLVDSVSVVWSASDGAYVYGYKICADEHPSVDFFEECDFRSDVCYVASQADDHVMFLTDDSYFYRDVPEVDPCAVMQAERYVLTFSLRLGRNTSICYMLKGRDQRIPEFVDMDDHLIWEWATADADFGYPGSLDGHIFHKKDLNQILHSNENWWNPNTLEDVFTRQVYHLGKPNMACFPRSVLVGVPVNRTSESHPGNRWGTKIPIDPAWFRDEYLEGRRIMFPDIHADTITAAHQELSLETV